MIAQIAELIRPLFETVLGDAMPDWLPTVAVFLALPGAMLTLLAAFVMFFVWLERKVSAHMQDRVGPMRVGGWHGWLQSLADPIKLLLKEDLAPDGSDKLLFKLAPYAIFAATAAGVVALPWGPGMIGADLNVGILYILAWGSVAVPGILMASWASNNKWALFGGMRSAAQIVSYEIPGAIAIVIATMITGSLQMSHIVEAQTGGILNWIAFDYRYLFLGLPVALIFFIASLAEVNRTPFDLAEAESELVSGFHTEYSGMRFSFFFLAEYINMYIVSVLVAVVFFGGWEGAIPLLDGITTTAIGLGACALFIAWYLLADLVLKMDYRAFSYRFPGMAIGWLGFLIPVLIGTGPVTLVWKSFFFVFIQIWLRWTLPRIRVDQLMEMSWKYLLPACFVIFVAIGALTYAPWNANAEAEAGQALQQTDPAPIEAALDANTEGEES